MMPKTTTTQPQATNRATTRADGAGAPDAHGPGILHRHPGALLNQETPVNMNASITPTIGRMVLVTLASGAIRPAIVHDVHSPSCISVTVQAGANDTELTDERGGVPVAARLTSISQDQEGRSPGSWHWMPYQLGQAAKSDGEVAQLRDAQNTDREALMALAKRVEALTATQPAKGQTSGQNVAAPPAVSGDQQQQ